MQEEAKNDGQNGYDNVGYCQSENHRKSVANSEESEVEEVEETVKLTWNNSIEFLMSCIAVSIGFGNIWRFPFTAYENGGGAFLIPYIIILFLVGKPFYFLEMILGQFSGYSAIKVWSLCPGFIGIGFAQLFSNAAVASYYTSLMALTLFFLIASFSSELPWAKCRDEWGEYCVDSMTKRSTAINASNFVESTSSYVDDSLYKLSLLTNNQQYRSSAELYFLRVVLQEKESIEDGIGLPDWKLTLCLCASWLTITLVTFQGVKSSGRASYFLAIFPYIILISLLGRAVTLEGAIDGILFFVTPKWSKLLEPTVWYAAVTQCFFSLSVCFGTIITYSSHNDFKHNIYRDVLIVTTLDTITSTMAGCTIFGILGNLAYEMDVKDIGNVVRAGAGLAFISYPDAIAKFSFLPQLFSVLFFVMMFVLGVGSSVGMISGIVTALNEKFPKIKTWKIVLCVCTPGFLISTIYVTPGGQFILTLVDYYGTSFVVFILAAFEIVTVTWIYGLENFLHDVEFLIDRKPSIYWRICWLIVTPFILITILIYTFVTLSPLTYGGREYPYVAYICGWIVLGFGILQIPFWMLREFFRYRKFPPMQLLEKSFAPASEWGPRRFVHRKNWLLFKEEKAKEKSLRTQPAWLQLLCVVLRIEPR